MVGVLLVGLALLGCGDDDDETGEPAADATLDSAGDAATPDVGDDTTEETAPDEEVVEGSSAVFEVRLYSDSGPEYELGAGATVTFDTPSGERLEAVTGADGRVTFDNIDWTAGETASVTGYLEGWALDTHVGLTEANFDATTDDGSHPLGLTSPPVPVSESWVELSGHVSQMDSSAYWLVVCSTVRGSYHQEQGPDWTLSVTPDTPFRLVVLEWRPTTTSQTVWQEFYGWTVVEHDGVTEPTTVDIDMSTAVAGTTFSGSMQAPEHAESDFFSEGTPYATVDSRAIPNLFLGAMTGGELADDGVTWEYDGNYFPLADVEGVITRYWWRRNQESSYVAVDGFPSDGPQDLAFPEPVRLTSITGTQHHVIGQELTWEMNAVDEADPDLWMVVVLTTIDWETVQTIHVPPGTTSLVIPPLPSGVDSGDIYGAGVRGYIELFQFDAGRSPPRASRSRFFGVQPE